jgi:chromosome segregation ATPase
MSNGAIEASKSLKTIGNEITQWENRLEFVKNEVSKNTQTRDAIAAEISKKTQDFEVYMATRDVEMKKSRADILAEREQLNKDKTSFTEIIKKHQQEKELLNEQKRDFENEKSRHAATITNIQEFITAVRRASGLLNI